MILPGNEVIFSLETASDYLKDDRASSYGFRCLVVGYEWPFPGSCGSTSGLKLLEAELAFLGGMCCASLMKKDLLLPNTDCCKYIVTIYGSVILPLIKNSLYPEYFSIRKIFSK